MGKGNLNNLVPNSERTPEQRKALASKMGQASGEARRKRRSLRDAVEKVLSASYEEADGSKLTGYEKLAIAIFQKGVQGYDVAAFNSIRDLIGEKPVDKVAMAADEESAEKMEEFFTFLSSKENK